MLWLDKVLSLVARQRELPGFELDGELPLLRSTEKVNG